MSDRHMTEDEFIALIGAYGGKPENWPQENRAAMQTFCRDNSQAEALLSRERMLDGWLDSQLPPLPEGLAARLEADMRDALETPTAPETPNLVMLRPPVMTRRFFASTITALAACFVGGFVAAPLVIDTVTGGNDLIASLDIISEIFIPTEPL